MIRVFLPNETDFTSNGERVINLRKCIEHRERLDWYLDIVANLEYKDVLQNDYIIVVKTKEKGYQPFRIKNPKLTNRVEAKAEHIGFDLKNYACTLSTILNESCLFAMNKLLLDSQDTTPFTTYTNISGLKSFSNIDTNLLEGLKRIANEFNGELDFDGWQVRITGSIGVDRGVVLSYGNNIQESEVNENWDLVVTKLKPIGNDGITLSPEWLVADVSYQRPYTKIMTFDSDTIENLQMVAQLYLDRYKVPRVNYKVKADVEQNVGLGDAIVVRAKQFTVNAEVLSFDFDVIKNRVISVEFGNYRPTLKNFFNEMAMESEEKAVKRASVKIDEVNGTIESIASTVNDFDDRLITAEQKITPESITSVVRNSIEYIQDLESIELTPGPPGKDSIKVDIISSNGNIFKNGSISTILFARVYQGSIDITDNIDSSKFRWTRKSSDEESDDAWNTSNFGGSKQVVITSSDVLVRSTFICEILDL